METAAHPRGARGRGGPPHFAQHKHWDRGGSHNGPHSLDRGSGRGRGTRRPTGRRFPNQSLRGAALNAAAPSGRGQSPEDSGQEEEEEHQELGEVLHVMQEDPDFETNEEFEAFYQELVKAREVERKLAIAEGKMDDPLVPKRLEDAITLVGTCMDMCPRFERYRRQKQHNLVEWEVIPGTRKVDHRRAVKMYERGAGDKVLPSDLRPPEVLKRTLDYLFHNLQPKEGFSKTFSFIRDRSRAVRNDFTMQHETGPLAIECHDRCARFHILALHFERDRKDFSVALEEQQLMNTLQSLKEFYEDQRGRYESPTELEMRVYHRLIHIRDQRERHEDIPEHIQNRPVFKLTTDFRLHVQRKSAPITKTSALVVDAEGMQIFMNLANVLREEGNVVMIYLVACILERLFGKETIEDIEAIRSGLSIPQVIDGVSSYEVHEAEEEGEEVSMEDEWPEVTEIETTEPNALIAPAPINAPFFPTSEPSSSTPFVTAPATPNVESAVTTTQVQSPFATSSSSNVFGIPSSSPFGIASGFQATTKTPPVFGSSETNPFASSTSTSPSTNPFSSTTSTNPFGPPSSSNPFAATPPAASNPSANTSLSFSLNPTVQPFTPRSVPFLSSEKPSPAPAAPANNSIFSVDFSSAKASGEPSAPAPVLPTIAPSVIPTSKPAATAPISSPQATHQSSPGIFAFPTDSNGTAAGTLEASHPEPTSQPSDPPKELPKLHTSIPFSSVPTPVDSPRIPPPAPRPHILSLPSTPTATITRPIPNFFNNSITTSFGPALQDGALSPLIMTSPMISRYPSLNDIPKASSSKAKQSPKKSTTTSPEALQAKADTFARASLPVQDCFKRWKRRHEERVEYLEAIRKSDAYREEVHSRRPASSMKRYASTSSEVSMRSRSSSPQKVQPRKRPRRSQPATEFKTDEELAKRFLENQEEHQRRWALGSFLQLVRKRAFEESSRGTGTKELLSSWQIWLSMNPESDATAIWLQKKFDVPNSGYWLSEAVFSIPLMSTSSGSSQHPGMLIFECTPLDDVSDGLERKYRILDDCTRLRDIVETLPEKRPFVPSVLVIRWSENHDAPLPDDLVHMLRKYTSEQIILGHGIFSVSATTKDLDGKLSSILNGLALDVEGSLTHPMTLRAAINLFDSPLQTFLTEWLDNCSPHGYFSWNMYTKILQTLVSLLNSSSILLSELISMNGTYQLPPYPSDDVEDSLLQYESSIDWLSHAEQDDTARSIAMDLQSHLTLGRNFPARLFLEQVIALYQYEVSKRGSGDSTQKFLVPRKDSTSAVAAFESEINKEEERLTQTLSFISRRTPVVKRRGVSEDSDSSESSKRRKITATSYSTPTTLMSPPQAPQTNGTHVSSPPPESRSPTASVISVTPPEPSSSTITIAMLRALTKDMKTKYGGQ